MNGAVFLAKRHKKFMTPDKSDLTKGDDAIHFITTSVKNHSSYHAFET